MNLDNVRLEKVLMEFAQNLPDFPKWVGLVDHTGKLIASIGGFDYEYPNTPTSFTAAQQLKLCAESSYASLEAVGHGNFQSSIYIGGKGTLFIVNMNDAFFLGVSYHGVGQGCCYSFIDNTEEAIRHGSQLISNAIYLESSQQVSLSTEHDGKTDVDQEASTSTNTQSIDSVLKSFIKGLPGKPQWAMLIDDDGKLLGFAGEMHERSRLGEQPMNQMEFAKQFQQFLNTSDASLRSLKLGPLGVSILNTVGGVTISSAISADNHQVIIYYPPSIEPIKLMVSIIDKGIRQNSRRLMYAVKNIDAS